MGTGSSDHADPAGFAAAIPATAAELPPARHDFSRWLGDAGVDDDDVADLEVVFSELVTNAIAAATGPATPISTRAWLDRATVVVEVSNGAAGPGIDHARWDLADELRRGGRGLVIVRAFSDALEIDRTDGGAVLIRCRRAVRRTPPAGRS